MDVATGANFIITMGGGTHHALTKESKNNSAVHDFSLASQIHPYLRYVVSIIWACCHRLQQVTRPLRRCVALWTLSLLRPPLRPPA